MASVSDFSNRGSSDFRRVVEGFLLRAGLPFADVLSAEWAFCVVVLDVEGGGQDTRDVAFRLAAGLDDRLLGFDEAAAASGRACPSTKISGCRAAWCG